MPFYAELKTAAKDARLRTIDGLLTLRTQIARDVPARTPTHSLLLATWNIREFDSAKYGERRLESLYYIAEIIDHFDLVAIQEVNANLAALQRVMRILGSWWDVLYTDVTYGRAGNNERMAIVFDRRKVKLTGLTGEIVLPEDGKAQPARQLARSPFICGFQCGWIKFDLCIVHTYYGSAKPNEPRRLQEIDNLAAVLTSRTDAGSASNVILLGDFNIFKRTDETFKALLKHKFAVPEAIMKLKGSNIKRDKEYDQIAFLERRHRFTVGSAGVFNFYASVFGDNAEPVWKTVMGPGYAKAKNPSRYYKDWRTYQMSDHLPLWVELQINHTDSYLNYLKAV